MLTAILLLCCLMTEQNDDGDDDNNGGCGDIDDEEEDDFDSECDIGSKSGDGKERTESCVDSSPFALLSLLSRNQLVR